MHHAVSRLEPTDSDPALLAATVDVTDGPRYHPGGMDADRDCTLWVPLAEPRPSTATRVLAVARDGSVTSSFLVDDHLGWCAPVGDDGALMAGTWDSADLVVLAGGAEQARWPNSTGCGYQDARGLGDSVLATGYAWSDVGVVCSWGRWAPQHLVAQGTPTASMDVPWANNACGRSLAGDELIVDAVFGRHDGPGARWCRWQAPLVHRG